MAGSGIYEDLELNRAGSVVLDGAGNGIMTFTVGGYEIWDVQSAAITTAQPLTSVKVPQVFFYRNLPLPQNQVSASYNGVINTFRGSVKLWTGEYLNVQLLNGVPGATATVTIQGARRRRIG